MFDLPQVKRDLISNAISFAYDLRLRKLENITKISNVVGGRA